MKREKIVMSASIGVAALILTMVMFVMTIGEKESARFTVILLLVKSLLRGLQGFQVVFLCKNVQIAQENTCGT